jgi:hypothetical protein
VINILIPNKKTKKTIHINLFKIRGKDNSIRVFTIKREILKLFLMKRENNRAKAMKNNKPALFSFSRCDDLISIRQIP